MQTEIRIIPNLLGSKWLSGLLAGLAIVLSGVAGVLVSRLAEVFAGKEIFIVIALLGAWPFLWLCLAKSDLMVFVTFSLIGLVQIEPAPADLLLWLLLPLGLLSGKLSLTTLKGSSIVHFLLWGFLLANFISLMVVTEALSYAIRYTIIGLYMIVLMYFLKIYIISTETMRRVMIGYLISALINIFLIALGYLDIGPSEGLFVEQTRARGFFKDANVFGPFLVPMIVFLVAEVWRPHLLPGLYPVKIFSIIALTAGVFLSFSRAAWANLVLSLFVFFLLNLRGISRERIISLLKLVVVGSIILVVLVNLMGLGDFLKYRAAITQSYDTDRFAAQRYGLQAGLTHLAGVGPGLLDITFFAPHNVYIRTFGEHGVLGLVTFLALILILLIHAFFRGLRETDKPPYGISAKVVVASFVGLLFNSFVIDTIHWRHFWFLLALLWVISTTEASTYPSLPRVGGQRH